MTRSYLLPMCYDSIHPNSRYKYYYSTRLTLAGGIQDLDHELFVVATRLGLDNVLKRFTVLFNKGFHDLLHDTMVTKQAGRQEGFVGAEPLARRLDEPGNRFVRLEFHAEHKETSVTGITSQLGFHGLEQRKSVLVGIRHVDLFQIFRWRGTEKLEESLLVRSPFSLGHFVQGIHVFCHFVVGVVIRVECFFGRLQAVDDQGLHVSSEFRVHETTQIFRITLEKGLL
mmetsp:Transcript_15942/g.30104  ORF Transcript_15942/g.30104 Transcript_15942/m.30104 type:complete len:227 (+) Transcript_15942:18-698(+)